MSQKESGRLALLSVLAIGICIGCSGMLSPATANIAAQFPELPYESIALIMTIVNIVDLPVMLVVGMIAGKKIGFRPLCIAGTALFAFGGAIPYFFSGSYPVIMASRVILAVGCGLIMSLPATLAFRLFSGGKAQVVQGWANAVSSISGAIMMIVVGWIASVSIDLVWLTHLVGVISLVLVVIGLPEPEKAIETPQSQTNGTPQAKQKTPLSVWGLAFIAFAAMVAVYPMLLNSSIIITENGWGGTELAGICNAILSLGSFLSGMAFGKIYTKIPRQTSLFAGIVGAIASVLVFFASNAAMLLIGALLLGWAQMQFLCYAMGAAGILTPPQRTAFSMSLMQAGSNVAVFVAPYIASFVQSIVGASSYQAPFLAFAALWALIGVAAFVWYPEKRAAKPKTIEQ